MHVKPKFCLNIAYEWKMVVPATVLEADLHVFCAKFSMVKHL